MTVGDAREDAFSKPHHGSTLKKAKWPIPAFSV
jgi:hypothetical protein